LDFRVHQDRKDKIFESLGAGNVDGGFFQEIRRLDVAL
jgi:hypothetical protein